MEVKNMGKNREQNQQQTHDESLMDRVDEAFDNMVEDVKNMVQDTDQNRQKK